MSLAKATLVSFFIAVAVIACHKVLEPTPEQRILRGMPVAELSVSEFTFDIISAATVHEDGNVVLNVLTGSVLGAADEWRVLYRGKVVVRYGLNLEALGASDVELTPDRVLLRLPEPTVLGKPEITAASQVLDVYPEETERWYWLDSVLANKGDIQIQIRRQYQEQAPQWLHDFELEQTARERVRVVIQAWLSARLPDKAVIVEYKEGGAP